MWHITIKIIIKKQRLFVLNPFSIIIGFRVKWKKTIVIFLQLVFLYYSVSFNHNKSLSL